MAVDCGDMARGGLKARDCDVYDLLSPDLNRDWQSMDSGWRTLEESCKGLGSVSLKINNQHTQFGIVDSTNRAPRYRI
jgi:hypothetical protein